MFTDRRSKQVIFLAHCLLNQNSISDGTAVFPAAHKELLNALLDRETGIVQMPCPELCCLGLDRGNRLGAESPVVVENTRIRQELRKPDAAARLSMLADYVMLQIREYRAHGFDILGIVGADRSPSCGVNTTSDHDQEIPGMGEFTHLLSQRLQAEGVHIPMFGIKAAEDPAELVSQLLKEEI